MTKDEALKMAIDWFDMAEMDINDGAYKMALPIIKACKEALSQPKKPQYLCVYARNGEVNYIYDEPIGCPPEFVGKIKLEVDDE